ncbi:MAG: cob(I)yrinic acid a,c-diamide adenosyltransferase [Rhodothalassiaceae bacterium]
MVKLDKIYTRGGDAGETSLADGSRVPKTDLRLNAFGTVDEANATIGLARLHTDGKADTMLAAIQNDLFDLGADLSTPWGGEDPDYVLRIAEAQIERLEREMDQMMARLEPLTSFVLPGGSAASAHLHLARTVMRRAEREMVAADAVTPLNPAAKRYANRVSDHLFVLGRLLNEEGRADVLWVPGKNRG